MNDAHQSALAVVRELHAMGATYAQVGPEHVAAKFDRVFVPAPRSSLPVTLESGDEVRVSADDVQAMRDELEALRSMQRELMDRGVL
jgi:hypothetical protein